MRSPVVAAIVAAGLVVPFAAHADDPCAEDVKHLCGDVRTGGGRVDACLKRNEARLTPACSAKRAASEARFRARVEELAIACRTDAARLCDDVKPGRGRIIACLLRQQDDLSSGCRAQTDRVEGAIETIADVRAACGADVGRLCASVSQEAGPLVECMQSRRAELSESCRTVDVELAMAAAELVDAVAALSSQEQQQTALQILQGIESIAFARSQVIIQVDSFQGLGGRANANRFLFNPQLVFGRRNELALQLRAPVLAVYPYAPDAPAQTGLGAVTTSFAWGFFASTRVRQYVALGLQWRTATEPPVGGAWAVTPGYAISVAATRFLSVSGQVAWLRSFASSGLAEVNLLVVDPIIVVRLPGRTFAAVDAKLGFDLSNGSFVPVVKSVVGIHVNRQRSLAISAWYQRALSGDAERQIFTYGVGAGLAYFFDW